MANEHPPIVTVYAQVVERRELAHGRHGAAYFVRVAARGAPTSDWAQLLPADWSYGIPVDAASFRRLTIGADVALTLAQHPAVTP